MLETKNMSNGKSRVLHGAMLFALLILFSGCVHTRATVLDTTIRPRELCPDGVKIYLTKQDAPVDYIALALLQSSGNDTYTTGAGMINSQRKKAAKLGANGLILSEQKDPDGLTKIAGALFGTSTSRKGNAVAILVPSDTTRAYQVCSEQAEQD